MWQDIDKDDINVIETSENRGIGNDDKTDFKGFSNSNVLSN